MVQQEEVDVHGMARSRKRLAGVLRRPPLLDSMVTIPNGPAEQQLDDLRTMLERAEAEPASDDDDEVGEGPG